LHYFATKMFEPIIASPYIDNGFFKVDIISDLLTDVTVALDINVFEYNSFQPQFTNSTLINIRKTSARNVYNVAKADLLEAARCPDENHCLVSTMLRVYNSTERTENFLLLSSPKNANIAPSNVTVANISKWRENDGTTFTITLQASTISLFVTLDLIPESNVTGSFSDNGFVMLTPQKVIRFTADTPISKDDLLTNLTIRTVTDVVSDN